MIIPKIWENKKRTKPPTRSFHILYVLLPVYVEDMRLFSQAAEVTRNITVKKWTLFEIQKVEIRKGKLVKSTLSKQQKRQTCGLHDPLNKWFLYGLCSQETPVAPELPQRATPPAALISTVEFNMYLSMIRIYIYICCV